MKIRSKKHLAFVRSKGCLISFNGQRCNQRPEAHHLMKMGGRGMGLKESDEWTVPLCRYHHSEVTDYGDEEKFWNKYGFKYEAVKQTARKPRISES